MLSLHNVTEETKLAFKWSIIGIATIILLLLLFRIGRNIKEHFYPTPPPAPTVLFGKLPVIAFPQNATNQKLTYVLDTVSGDLPAFPDRATVYPIQQPTPSFLNLQRAQQKAGNVNFLGQGSALSQTQYAWYEQQTPFRKLIMDIVSFNFSLTSDFLTNTTLLQNATAPLANDAITTATNFLNRLSLLPSDIDTTKTTTQIFSITNQQLVKATSKSLAQVTQVNFFQNDIEKLPIYYANPPGSSMSFLVTNTGNENQVLATTFTHFSIDSTKSSTYPIKSASKAFEELKAGKAYIATTPGTQTTVHIKNVLLGYYLGDTPQEYLLPIIIFQGDNFFAYVPAITNPWLSSPSR